MNLKKAIKPVELKETGLVILQCLLLVLFFILPEACILPFGGFLRPIGYGAVMLGGALVVWASIRLGKGLSHLPSPNKKAKLITTGPFRYVRHPIYAGFLYGILGLALVSGSTTKLAKTGIALYFFAGRASHEEKKLVQRFPEYSTYKKQVGQFLPKIKPSAF